MAESLGYLEQTNEARNQRAQINWIRDDLSRLGEVRSLSEARNLVSQIQRDVNILNSALDPHLGPASQRRDQRRDTMNRLREMSNELPDQIDNILFAVEQTPATELADAVLRVRDDATAVVPELQKVTGEIRRVIDEIPGADARLQGRLLLVIERILDELRRSSDPDGIAGSGEQRWPHRQHGRGLFPGGLRAQPDSRQLEPAQLRPATRSRRYSPGRGGSKPGHHRRPATGGRNLRGPRAEERGHPVGHRRRGRAGERRGEQRPQSGLP